MKLRYAVGLGLLVDDAETVGPYLRDELLFAFAESLSGVVDYEIREVLPGSFETTCGAPEGRENVIVARHPDIGGPLAAATSDAIIAELDAIGREGSLESAPPMLDTARGVLLPPWVPPRGVLPAPASHPLHGLPFVNMIAARNALEHTPGTEHLRALLAVCARHLLLVSYVIGSSEAPASRAG